MNGKLPENFIKKEVAGLPAYNPGMPEDVVRKKYGLSQIARLASNENPLGVGRLAREAAEQAAREIWKYSDPASSALRSALEEMTGVESGRIVIGNGSEDIICLLCRAVLERGDRVVTVHPSFPLHEIYPEEQGADVVLVPMTDELQFDIDALVNELENGCKMLMISNPSNPVGAMIDEEGFLRICRAAGDDTLLVIDEAYYEYVSGVKTFPDSLKIMEEHGNPYVVLRTFSKAYGIAGTRVGYGLFSDGLFADRINTLRTPFNINIVAQEAALASLGDKNHLEKTKRHNASERQRVANALSELGYRTGPLYANFLFVDCGQKSTGVAGRLLEHGIIVKPWMAAGYEDFIRVTIGRSEDNDALLNVLSCLR